MEVYKKQAPLVWILEHPHMYSLGNRGKIQDIQNLKSRIPIYPSSRGGQVTYHGPGQLIVYSFFDLRVMHLTVDAYVSKLEDIIISLLKDFGLKGQRGKQPGIWINNSKIASIGIRVQKHVTSHGFSLNVCNDLKYFKAIQACGMKNCRFTNLKDSIPKTCDEQKVFEEVISKVKNYFNQNFG